MRETSLIVALLLVARAYAASVDVHPGDRVARDAPAETVQAEAAPRTGYDAAFDPEILRWRTGPATPGVQLRIREIERGLIPIDNLNFPAKARGTTALRYEVTATGLTPGKAYDVFIKTLGTPTKLLRHIDAGSIESVRVAPIPVAIVAYQAGGVIDVALKSADESIKAYAHATPFPIEGIDATCRVSLELVSGDGTVFLAWGSGFAPNERVALESISGETVTTGTVNASADGALMSIVSPATAVRDYRASVTMKGRTCQPKVVYQWGPAAVLPR